MGEHDHEKEEHELTVNDGPEPVGSGAVTGSDEKEDSASSSKDEQQHAPHATLDQVVSAASAASAAPSSSAVTGHGPGDNDDARGRSSWLGRANPLRWGKVPAVPDTRVDCPEHTANFLSKLLFHWQGPLMRTGYRRPLELNDIWRVNPDRAVTPTSDRVSTSFKERVARGDKYPLLWAMHEAYFYEFWLGGACQLSSTLFQVVSPFTLRYLIQFATDAYVAAQSGQPAPHLGRGLGLVFGVTLMQVCQSLGTNHFIFHGMMIGGQTRATLINLIYEKSMLLSGRAKAGGKSGDSDEDKNNASTVAGDGTGWGNGRITNLMGVDASRVDQGATMFHIVWCAPVACLLTLVLLLINLTYSALAGFGLLVAGLPLLTRAIKSLFVRRKLINRVTDQRVSLTQEILQSVRFVKFFGWEKSFIARLEEYRTPEVKMIQFLMAIRNAIMAISLSMPIFASMLSFICFSLTHHDMSPAKVFSSLALFNSLRIPLNLLPMVIGQVTDAWSSLKRVQDFLLAEEAEEEVAWRPDGEHAIEMHGASFTWERTPTQDTDGPGKKTKQAKEVKQAKEAKEAKPTKSSAEGDTASTLVEEPSVFKLHDLDLSIERHELVAVIGSVGSGKSSLLAALAGDMRKTGGEVVLGASRAFCPQYAWVQNTTLRNNILFGKAYDDAWYGSVIQACALQTDLDVLPAGDMTEIGERGITISGGQKQRLNIARAIYFDADIVLMDDPLSAVDAHVGRHIFDNAICGLLKDKCRVLATHQLWVLNRCDRIVWMEAGTVQAVDTYTNLMRDNEGFRQLMATTSVEEKKGEGDDDEEEEEEEEETTDTPKKKKKQHKDKGLMQSEEKAVDSVPWSTIANYVRSSGSLLNGVLVILLLLLSQGSNIVTSLWLSWWTADKFGFKMGVYIGAYAGLGAVQVVLSYAFMVSLSIFGTLASKAMLRRAVERVLRAPMSFFDTTPLGRITNRFSRDVDVLDNSLSDALRMYFFSVAGILSVFALIIAYFHYFAIALGPLFVVFLLATSYYRASAREVKRFEAVLRSNVFAKFGEGLSGVASIRAYGLRDHFVGELRAAIDDMNSAYYLTFSNQRWLAVRLDMIGNLLVFTTGILVVTSRFSVSPSTGGLVLSYILSIVQMIQFTVRQLAEVENGMNAVERLQYYGEQLEEEAPLHTVDVRPSWPEHGEIVFDDVAMRYRAGLPLVLRGLQMHVRGGERIGIVGRTGAGKSSIMSTLFRLVETSGGRITIDGIDIATIGLHDLRARMAIIPQDPTLFRGTVRSNLDPFNEHTDLELWSALRQADLVDEAEAEAEADTDTPAVDGTARDGPTTARITLDSVVEEEGLNFSLGQRQLMALARALVRNSQIIVCDEATSSVDMGTDTKIQATMARGFRGKTLLCIAHRLRTIIGYDRIGVMDQGRMAELDNPAVLYAKEGGIFRGMCDRSGIRAEDIAHAQAMLESYVDGGAER